MTANHDGDHEHMIREAAKWLIGASGVLAASLVAGLQLGDVARLATAGQIGRLAACATAASIALLLALSVLVAAARVIGKDWTVSVEDLCGREVRAGKLSARGALTSTPDFVLASVYARRSSLMMGHETVSDLQRAHLARPGDEQIAESLRRCSVVAARAMSSRAYARLLRTVSWLTPVFVCLVVAFAVLIALAPVEERIRQPLDVDMYVVDPSHSGLPSSCRQKQLRGMAVGGTLVQPVVVVPRTRSCPAMRLTVGPGVVVVPR